MCLSKLQDSAERIRSTSNLLSNEKRTAWSPIFLTLKPDLDLHRGVKVFAMASIFNGRLVRNLATIPCSEVAWSLLRHRPGPSISERDRELQCLVRSSMPIQDSSVLTKCFPRPSKNKPTSLAITELLQRTKAPPRGRDDNATFWREFFQREKLNTATSLQQLQFDVRHSAIYLLRCCSHKVAF